MEWYVQQKYDPTFKTAGGIILNRDETIGNVNVFRPNDGKVGVTPEEKAKMDQISDLDVQLEARKKELASVEASLDIKKQQTSEMDVQMRKILQAYEKSALELQMHFLGQIQALKDSFAPGMDEPKDNGDEGKGQK